MSCDGLETYICPNLSYVTPHLEICHKARTTKVTVYNRTVFKNGSCCTVQPCAGKVSCLQKFRHFWMIIRDLFFESGSIEATKIKKYRKCMSFIFLIK